MERDRGPDAGRVPRRLGDVLGELFMARGLGRIQATAELESAWAAAAGPEVAAGTRVAGIRHGILNITVAHPAVLEELAAFRKQALLEALRGGLPGLRLRDLRFRVGPVDGASGAGPTSPPVGGF